MLKRCLYSVALLAAFVAVPALASAATVTIDGIPIPDAVAQGGDLLVPFRAPMEQIGATVDWTDPVATASMGDQQLVQVTIGKTESLLYGNPHTLSVAPVLVNNLSYVPVELLADISHATVTYSADKTSAAVTNFDLAGISDVGSVTISWTIWGWILVAAGIISGAAGLVVQQQTAR
jgi:hypothetical protein